MEKLSEAAVQTAVAELPGWRPEAGELVREFTFPDFVAAMVFVNKAAEAAESAGHHPDIDIRYNRVRMAMVTHDAGGITQLDVQMAGRLGELGRLADERD
jgi:4a-hydroxytetrahydrobiopterin dehydratase